MELYTLLFKSFDEIFEFTPPWILGYDLTTTLIHIKQSFLILGIWISCKHLEKTGAQMIISGILDSRGVQEGLSVIVEFFTTEDIPDLSAYGIGLSETNVGYR